MFGLMPTAVGKGPQAHGLTSPALTSQEAACDTGDWLHPLLPVSE